MIKDMESRLAVLEEIAASTKEVLRDMRADIKDIRTHLKAVHEKQESDFRLLVGPGFSAAAALVAVMAEGFHWF